MKTTMTMTLCAMVLALVAAQSAIAAEGGGKPQVTKQGGTVTKIDATSITISAKSGGEKAAAQETTYNLAPTTQFMVQAAGGGGGEGKGSNWNNGTIADVKVGDRVVVYYTGNNADKIEIPTQPAQKKGGEGK